MNIPIERLRTMLKWSPECDSEVRQAIKAVSSDFCRLTGKEWELGPHVARFDDVNTDDIVSLFLPETPVIEITSILEQNAKEDPRSILESEYILREDTGEIIRTRSYPFYRRVEVSYIGGPQDLPFDVERAILLEVRRTLLRDSPEKIVSLSDTVEGGRTQFTSDRVHPYFSQTVHRRKSRG